MTEKVILFDGVCNLCNAAVQFVIKRDRQQEFKFASLQSDYGRQLLREHGFQEDDLHSFIFQDGEKIYTQSTAALKVAQALGGFWRLAYGFMIVPRFIRDAVYRLIAHNRYAWFGKKEACWIPTPALSSRFLA